MAGWLLLPMPMPTHSILKWLHSLIASHERNTLRRGIIILPHSTDQKKVLKEGSKKRRKKLSSPQALSALPNAQIFHTFSALASLQINCNFLPWKMYWNSFLTITNTSNSAANKNSKKKILSALHGRGYVANMTFLLICSVGMSRANISYLKLNMTFDI